MKDYKQIMNYALLVKDAQSSNKHMDLYDMPDSKIQFYCDSFFFQPMVSSINSSISGIPESKRSQSFNGFFENNHLKI